MSRTHFSQEVNHVGHQEASQHSIAPAQQLSGSLLEHLKPLVPEALADAENCSPNWKSSAEKRKKNCTSPAPNCRTPAAESKAQAKAKDAVADLEELLDPQGIVNRKPVATFCNLARCPGKPETGPGSVVQEAVGKALSLRAAKPAAAPAKKAAAKPVAAKAPAKLAAKAPVKAAAKPAARKAVAASAAKPAVKTTPAKPAAAKSSAARTAAVKPAVAKTAAANQLQNGR
jgi:hypothetical protein